MSGADFRIENHGTVVLLIPQTEAARAWVDEHLAPRLLRCNGGVAVEPRMIGPVLDGALDKGLTVAG
mgnify:FL=1